MSCASRTAFPSILIIFPLLILTMSFVHSMNISMNFCGFIAAYMSLRQSWLGVFPHSIFNNLTKYSLFNSKKYAILLKSSYLFNIPYIVIIIMSINLYFFPRVSRGSSNTSNLSNKFISSSFDFFTESLNLFYHIF